MSSDSTSLQDAGRRLLATLYAALRALKFYPVENVTVQNALDELHSMVSGLIEKEQGVDLRVLGDFFFLNETRLRLDLTNYATFGAFARALLDHGLGGVDIRPGVTREEWAPFLSLLLREPGQDDPYAAFVDRIAGTPVEHIEFEPEKEVHEPAIEEAEQLEAAKRTYAQSVRMAHDALTDMRLGRAVNVRKVKRSVQTIVDQVLVNEPSMITMTTLRDFDEYTFSHSVNVCIFSIVIGQRLGLVKLQLYDLGLAALFHDVGKMRLASEVINKPSALNDEEWEHLREHPTEGLLVLFKLHGFAEVPYRQMLVAYEHHMKVDATGYPTNHRPRLPGLFSRIVAVADAFDAGTSVRSYQYKPWPPDQVLQEMRDNPRRGFDPLIVKALINSTGVFPIGTLAILDTLEMGIVSGVNPDLSKLHQPTVKIISDAMGVPLGTPIQADLSEIDPTTSKARRSIIKTADPQKYGIRVADYLM